MAVDHSCEDYSVWQYDRYCEPPWAHKQINPEPEKATTSNPPPPTHSDHTFHITDSQLVDNHNEAPG